MNFNDAPERKISPFLRPGSDIVLKINDIELEKSKNNDSVRPVFYMESRPITDPTFSGWEGAKGQIGRVSGNAGFYLKNDNQKQQFLGDLRDIAVAVGKLEELQGLPDGEFTELVKGAAAVLRGSYARYFIAGSEYPKPGDKYGVKLTFPNKNFVTSLEGESTLEKFDRNNPKHYQAIPKTDAPKLQPKDDLPF